MERSRRVTGAHDVVALHECLCSELLAAARPIPNGCLPSNRCMVRTRRHPRPARARSRGPRPAPVRARVAVPPSSVVLPARHPLGAFRQRRRRGTSQLPGRAVSARRRPVAAHMRRAGYGPARLWEDRDPTM
eukprot:gene9645-biopygen13788